MLLKGNFGGVDECGVVSHPVATIYFNRCWQSERVCGVIGVFEEQQWHI